MRIEVGGQWHLSYFGEQDVPRLVELLDDPQIYATTLRIPSPYRQADAEQWIELARTLPAQFAVREADGRLIGGCGLELLRQAQRHVAEIGYWLGRDYWGQGIMTNVVRQVCQHGFQRMRLRKISAHVFVGNRASARVLQKCRFQLEGTLRKHWRKDERLIDAWAYGLLE